MKELRKFGDVEVGFVTQFNNTFSNREANLDDHHYPTFYNYSS